MTQSRAPRRSRQEWLQLITECRSNRMTDRTWCEQHGILVSSFYNAVKRLRKKACDIPYVSNRKPYALDLTSSKQEAVQIDIYPDTIPDAAVPAPHIGNSQGKPAATYNSKIASPTYAALKTIRPFQLE